MDGFFTQESTEARLDIVRGDIDQDIGIHVVTGPKPDPPMMVRNNLHSSGNSRGNCLGQFDWEPVAHHLPVYPKKHLADLLEQSLIPSNEVDDDGEDETEEEKSQNERPIFYWSIPAKAQQEMINRVQPISAVLLSVGNGGPGMAFELIRDRIPVWGICLSQQHKD